MKLAVARGVCSCAQRDVAVVTGFSADLAEQIKHAQNLICRLSSCVALDTLSYSCWIVGALHSGSMAAHLQGQTIGPVICVAERHLKGCVLLFVQTCIYPSPITRCYVGM